MKEYKYYIAYAYEQGYGYFIIERNAPIATTKDIASIHRLIETHNNYPEGSAIILNWKKLEEY